MCPRLLRIKTLTVYPMDGGEGRRVFTACDGAWFCRVLDYSGAPDTPLTIDDVVRHCVKADLPELLVRLRRKAARGIPVAIDGVRVPCADLRSALAAHKPGTTARRRFILRRPPAAPRP